MIPSINASRLQGDGIPRQVDIVGDAQLEGGCSRVLRPCPVGRVNIVVAPLNKADAAHSPDYLIAVTRCRELQGNGVISLD